MKTIQLILFKILQFVLILLSMSIASLLLNWYKNNKRDLPWRNLNDPYYIWISEIILQQTRINQGTPYFLNFIEKFPNVKSLALASEEEVLLSWQGLGYYSRARNLHSAAKYIFNDLNNTFPNKYTELIKLKGVGNYTAAAIASFCFNECVPAIDGNVYRLITRLYDIDKPIDKSDGQSAVLNICESIIPKNNARDFNQALMDFGSMICKPKNPTCENCPLSNKCISYSNKTINTRPVKSQKTKVNTRHFHFFVFKYNNHTIIEKRTKNDIWKGLYQFPLIETKKEITTKEILSTLFKGNYINKQTQPKITIQKLKPHKLSHQTIYTTISIIESPFNSKPTQLKIKLSNSYEYAFPILLKNFIENNLQ